MPGHTAQAPGTSSLGAMTILDQEVPLMGPGSSGAALPFGAQVLSWAPEGETSVLWTSHSAILDGSAPIRGGIPVCLPWFGSGNDGTCHPSHGFARTAWWTRVDDPMPAGRSHSSHSTAFRLDHEPSNADDDEPFPHRLEALLRVDVTEDLVITLRVTNTDDHAFTFEEALHTYLRVGDVKDVTIDGLEGADYLDTTREPHQWRQQVGEVTLVGPTDRIYRSGCPLSVHDPRLRRTINIDKDGSANTVIWNPWVEGAAALSDLDDQEWQEFVCMETANVRDDAITLKPGEDHEMVLILHADTMA